MKYIFTALFFMLLSGCGKSSEQDRPLQEEKHLENKDHTELSDNDSIPQEQIQ